MKISGIFKPGKIKAWQGLRPLFKKALASLAAVALVCSAIPLMSWAVEGDEFTQDELTYTVLTEEAGNSTVSLATANLDISGAITIPPAVKNSGTEYTVTKIEDSAFSYCESLTSITIPDSVTEIGYGAFYYCASLTQVTIGNSVTSIGIHAFYGCTGLTSITIPDSVTSIGVGAFAYCTGLNSITIPDSVTSIGFNAFKDCTELISIKIPSGFDKNKFAGSSVENYINDTNTYTISGTNGTFTYIKSAPIASDFTFIPPIQTTYDGTPKYAIVTAKDEITGMGTITTIYYSSDGGTTWSTNAPTEAGTYKVKIDVSEGDGYTAATGLTDKSWTFTIDKLDLSTADVTISPDTYTYTGSAWEPTVTVKDGSGNLIDSSNYTTAWTPDMKDAGAKTLTITSASSNCTGSKIINKTIAPTDITDFSVIQTGTLTYNGQAQMAAVEASTTTVNGQTATFTYSKTETGEYTDTVPSFTEAGSHTVYYKVTAPNHNDATGSFTVTIAPLDVPKQPDNNETAPATTPQNVPTVTKLKATYADSQPISAYYGQTLGELTGRLTAPTGVDGKTLAGTWSWEVDPDTKLTTLGANSFKVIFTPDNGNYEKIIITVTLEVATDKTAWGAETTENGVTFYVAEDGTTSAEITGNKMIWLKESSDGTSAWYAIDNSSGEFAQGSRFWVRWLSQQNDSTEWQKYYDEMDETQKSKVEANKLWIFLVGVTSADGTEYTNFSGEVPLYIQLGQDWDKNDVKAVFIANGSDEAVNSAYLEAMDYPAGSGEFAKLSLKHFSPYAVYDELKVETTTENNSTKAPTQEDNSPWIIFAVSTLLLGGGIIIILKKKSSKNK